MPRSIMLNHTHEDIQYISQPKLEELKLELLALKEGIIPNLAKRIDEAKQMGDLSENAEYHAAREEMAWAQSRVKELEHIINNAQLITDDTKAANFVSIGSHLVVEVGGVRKEYTIVGAQEADPAASKISNESPLGQAFLGKQTGETVEVQVPAGTQTYRIIEVK